MSLKKTQFKCCKSYDLHIEQNALHRHLPSKGQKKICGFQLTQHTYIFQISQILKTDHPKVASDKFFLGPKATVPKKKNRGFWGLAVFIFLKIFKIMFETTS